MPHFTEISVLDGAAAGSTAQLELLERWEKMVAAQTRSSVEINALTAAEADAYIQQRRAYEQQAMTAEPSLSCR